MRCLNTDANDHARLTGRLEVLGRAECDIGGDGGGGESGDGDGEVVSPPARAVEAQAAEARAEVATAATAVVREAAEVKSVEASVARVGRRQWLW